MIGTKAGTGFKKLRKTADQEARSDEQYHGKREFRRDEKSLQAMMRPAGSSAATALLQPPLRARAGGLERGSNAEHHSGQARYGNRECEHPATQRGGVRKSQA